jgi:hypothetical protein
MGEDITIRVNDAIATIVNLTKHDEPTDYAVGSAVSLINDLARLMEADFHQPELTRVRTNGGIYLTWQGYRMHSFIRVELAARSQDEHVLCWRYRYSRVEPFNLNKLVRHINKINDLKKRVYETHGKI